MNQSLLTKNTIFKLSVIFILIAGFLIRIKGITKWPVAVDEYYIIKAVQNILQSGIPEYTSGGYYERGILYQYLTAFLSLTGFNQVLAARIIPVLTNILTAIPLYLLAKRMGNKLVVVLIMFLFCFSVWEVEFARFARMYSPFQFLFITYIYFLFRWFTESNDKYYKWLIIISLISIFVYEASIFLALLNFIPFIWRRNTFSFDSIKKRKVILLSSLIVLFVAYHYLRFNFRSYGQQNLYPAGFSNGGDEDSPFRLPMILISTTIFNFKWLAVALLSLSGISIISFRLFKQTSFSTYNKFALLIIILLSILNLYGLLLYSTIIFLLIKWVTPDTLKCALKYLIPILLITMLFTSAYILLGSWHEQINFTNARGIAALKLLYKEFINYPNLYESFVLFRNTMPWHAYITIVLLSLGLFKFVYLEYKNAAIAFMYFIFMIVVLMITILNLTYFDTRYFFFLYPLIILLIGNTLVSLLNTKKIRNTYKYSALAIILLIGLIISEDYDYRHLINIDSRDVNFRIGLSKAEKIHFYPRWDTRSPAEYINNNAKTNDIIITNEQVNDFYLKRINYIYRDFRNADFRGESVLAGKKERWTNADLIYNEQQLFHILQTDTPTKWLLINTMWGTKRLKYANFFQTYDKYAVYANSDSSAIVYKIPSNHLYNFSSN